MKTKFLSECYKTFNNSVVLIYPLYNFPSPLSAPSLYTHSDLNRDQTGKLHDSAGAFVLFILLPALCLLVEGQSNLENLQTSFQPVHAWCTPVNQSTIHTVYNKTLLSILLQGMATFQDIYMPLRATTEFFFFIVHH